MASQSQTFVAYTPGHDEEARQFPMASWEELRGLFDDPFAWLHVAVPSLAGRTVFVPTKPIVIMSRHSGVSTNVTWMENANVIHLITGTADDQSALFIEKGKTFAELHPLGLAKLHIYIEPANGTWPAVGAEVPACLHMQWGNFGYVSAFALYSMQNPIAFLRGIQNAGVKAFDKSNQVRDLIIEVGDVGFGIFEGPDAGELGTFACYACDGLMTETADGKVHFKGKSTITKCYKRKAAHH